MTLHTRLLGILAVITTLLTLTCGHNIQLRAHSHECFHENLHIDDKMTVTFQVGDREFGGSGNLEIDFYVRPTNIQQYVDEAFQPQLTQYQTNRYAHQTNPISSSNAPSPQAITHSPPTKTANTPTASTTPPGPRPQRKSPSTSTVSSTCPNQIWRRIR